MEQLSVPVRRQLQQFLKNWDNEISEVQQIVITKTHLTLTMSETSQITLISDIVGTTGETVFEKCQNDLMQAGTDIIPFPAYIQQDFGTRLHTLLTITKKDEFQQRKSLF
jgi:hypothetical protein